MFSEERVITQKTIKSVTKCMQQSRLQTYYVCLKGLSCWIKTSKVKKQTPSTLLKTFL